MHRLVHMATGFAVPEAVLFLLTVAAIAGGLLTFLGVAVCIALVVQLTSLASLQKGREAKFDPEATMPPKMPDFAVGAPAAGAPLEASTNPRLEVSRGTRPTSEPAQRRDGGCSFCAALRARAAAARDFFRPKPWQLPRFKKSKSG